MGKVPMHRGKQGKLQQQNPCQEKPREFRKFYKTQGLLNAPVVNYLILMIEGIMIFATKFCKFSIRN